MKNDPQCIGLKEKPGRDIEAVVIGASAGAIDALSRILPALPEKYPVPVMIVVHLPSDQDSILAEIFAPKCRVPVKEAEDKEPIQGGTVYFAAPNYHLLVEPDRRLSLSTDEPILFSRPSIDVLFESAADVYGKGLLGIVLTGANSDGALGLSALTRAGGTALIQSPASAEAPLMPQSALKACPGARALALEEIALILSLLPKLP